MYLNIPIILIESVLEYALEVILSALIIITTALAIARRRKNPPKAVREELKLAVKSTSHRVVLPSSFKYEYGVVEIIKSVGLFALEGEVRVKWSGAREYNESDFVDMGRLCSSPLALAKHSTTLYISMPAVRLMSGRFKDSIIACLDTEKIDATGFVFSTFENGYARGHVRMSRGLLSAVLEISYSQVEVWERVKARLELCSTGKTRLCMKLLEAEKSGVFKTEINYPALKMITIGGMDGGFDEALKVAESLPPVLGSELILKLVIKKGALKKISSQSRLE